MMTTPIDTPLLADLLAVAQETAVAAGNLTRDYFLQPRQLIAKGKNLNDLVTDADLAAQECITTTIRQRFPDHGFLPEETNTSLPTTGPIIWIIDPVDGTFNYSRQQPLYAVSVAATQPQPDGSYLPLAGAIYDPIRDELFSAAVGMGATCNDAPISVSNTTQLDKAFLGVDWSYSHQFQASALNVVMEMATAVQSIRALGTAALALSWVAAGRFDAYINFNLQPWDVAAAVVIIAEAGGSSTNFGGGPLSWAKGMDCAMSNGRVHQTLLRQLSQSQPAIN